MASTVPKICPVCRTAFCNHAEAVGDVEHVGSGGHEKSTSSGGSPVIHGSGSGAAAAVSGSGVCGGAGESRDAELSIRGVAPTIPIPGPSGVQPEYLAAKSQNGAPSDLAAYRDNAASHRALPGSSESARSGASGTQGSAAGATSDGETARVEETNDGGSDTQHAGVAQGATNLAWTHALDVPHLIAQATTEQRAISPKDVGEIPASGTYMAVEATSASDESKVEPAKEVGEAASTLEQAPVASRGCAETGSGAGKPETPSSTGEAAVAHAASPNTLRSRVIHGAMRDVLAKEPENSIDCCLTDSPYALTAKTGQNFPGRYEKNKRVSAGGFLGAKWDSELPSVDDWKAVYRVLKPGAYLLNCGGGRTYHRMACMVEDAGFEIVDMIEWVYFESFAKSMSISKSFDKANGVERSVVGIGTNGVGNTEASIHKAEGYAASRSRKYELTVPSSDEAKTWDGWGTALRPCHEPIVVARKPMVGTYVANIRAHKTGALNVDGCRLPTKDDLNGGAYSPNKQDDGLWGSLHAYAGEPFAHPGGRWPPNVISAPRALGNDTRYVDLGEWARVNGGDRAYGELTGLFVCNKPNEVERDYELDGVEYVSVEYTTWDGEDRKARLLVGMESSRRRMVIAAYGTQDSCATEWSTTLFGSATTDPFRRACKFTIETKTRSTTGSKISTALARSIISAFTVGASGSTERVSNRAENAVQDIQSITITSEPTESLRGAGLVASLTRLQISACAKPEHPTMKPVTLFRWFCRLFCHPEGTILDPYCGSGTTGVAAIEEGHPHLLIEREAEYIPIIEARVAHAHKQGRLFGGNQRGDGAGGSAVPEPTAVATPLFDQRSDPDEEKQHDDGASRAEDDHRAAAGVPDVGEGGDVGGGCAAADDSVQQQPVEVPDW